jgi:hypothetical protein
MHIKLLPVSLMLCICCCAGVGDNKPPPHIEPEPDSYIACGCGCCSGVEPVVKCLYHSKGDDIKTIMSDDQKRRASPDCAYAGCSEPVKYVYCD